MKIKEQAIHQIINIEPVFLITALVLSAWAFYKFLLRGMPPERHQKIRIQFQFIKKMYYFFIVCFLSYFLADKLTPTLSFLERPSIYLGFITFILGSIVVVKTSRLILLQYLFLGSMRSGVPLLIVNIFSLIMSFALVLWGLSFFFDIDLGPLLATSAALSIVLGLALQDTLGNLFAGISLQMDHSFEIGDWVEVINGNQKTVGQVTEISWRSTTLMGWFNETVTLPNRFLAGTQISNFKKGEIAIYRNFVFRVPHNLDTEYLRRGLLESLRQVSGVRHDLPSTCVIFENHDSWLGLRLSYAIDDYSRQFLINHEVFLAGTKALREAGVVQAHQKYELINPPPLLRDRT